jgi:hypothetical protein
MKEDDVKGLKWFLDFFQYKPLIDFYYQNLLSKKLIGNIY